MGNSTSSCETCDLPIQCLKNCPKEIQRENNRKNIHNIQIAIEYYKNVLFNKNNRYRQSTTVFTIKKFKNVIKYLKIYNSTFSDSSSSNPEKIIENFVKTISDQNSLNIKKSEIKNYNFNDTKYFIITFELKPDDSIQTPTIETKIPSAPSIDQPPSYVSCENKIE